MRRCVTAWVLVIASCLPFAMTVSGQGDTSTAASTSEQPSLQGGVGNTRSDFYAAYGEIDQNDADTVFVQIYEDERSEFFVLNSQDGELQIFGSFRLEEDNKRRLTDRVIDFAIEGLEPWSVNQAVSIAFRLLPKDAEPIGDWVANDIGEPVHLFHSDDIARLLPNEATCTGHAAGTIWLTLATYGDDSVVVIEVSVSDPAEAECT